MKNYKIRMFKIATALTCVLVAAGSVTYVNNQDRNTVMAKTISDLEDEMAANNAEIAELEKEISSYDNDIANAKYKQTILQQKLKVQTANLDIVVQKIDSINNKIKDTKDKVSQLKVDIEDKQDDIDVGMEQFKERLRAMYITGNDSLASALVGATDFYDMLSKMELISQVSKHDSELIDSLMTQLEQLEEAKIQLDIAQSDLNKELKEQNKYKDEFTEAIAEINADYQESEEFIDLQQAKIDAAKSNINQYEADNRAMDSEIDKINQIAAAAASSSSSSNSNSSSNSSSGSTGGGSSSNDYNNGDDYNEPDDPDDGNDYNDPDEPDNSGGGFSGSMTWPVSGVYAVSSEYGSRWGSFHNGMDISNGNTMGATVVAAESGTVILAMTGCSHNYGKDSSCGCNGGFGNYLMIDHGDGVTTLYGHCSSVNVSVGQYVSRGEAVATAGSTGWSTGAHLHFEVRVNGSTVDPASYLY